jgi:hypothetical protein
MENCSFTCCFVWVCNFVSHTEGGTKTEGVREWVLRRICGPKRDEATVEWRKLHNEELNDLYSPPNIIRVIKSRRIRWVGHVAPMAEKRGADRLLVGRPEGRRPVRRPRHRWEDNIKMDLKEVRWGMD